MKRSALGSEKTLMALILLLGALTLAFQLRFKPRVDAADVLKLKNHFTSRKAYVGVWAPDFELPCTDGSTFRLSDNLASNVVILNFFTTWCGPCRSEMEELGYFVEKTSNSPVVFVAINVGEDSATVRAFLAKEEIKFRVALDERKTVAEQYRVGAFPTTVLIEPSGRIMLYEVGAIANADVSLMPLVNMYAGMITQRKMTFDLKAYQGGVKDRLPSAPQKEENVTELVPIDEAGAETNRMEEVAP